MKEDTKENESYGFGIRHLQVACMGLCASTLFIMRSIMGVAILAMTNKNKQDEDEIYDWDKKTQGLILSSFFWGYAVMQIPAGLLSKRFGGKPILLFALMGNGVTCLILPTMVKWGGWPSICVARALMGLTQACLLPTNHTLFGRWLPSHERNTLSGLVYGATTLGIIISMPISGVLSDTKYGWKLIFYVSGGLSLAVGTLWWFLASSSPAEHRMISPVERDYILKSLPVTKKQKILKAPWKGILTCKAFWAVMCPHIATAVCFISLLVDLPTYMEKGLHMSISSSATLSALPYIGMLIGTILSSYACDKLINCGYLSLLMARRAFNSFALFGMAIGLVALTFFDSSQQGLAIVMLTIVMFTQSFTLPGFMMNHLDLSPNYGGLTLAMTNFIANICSMMAPLVTSIILRNDPTDVSRWRVVFGVLAAICAVCNVIYVIFSSVERQLWDDPDYEDKKEAGPGELKPVLVKSTDEA